MLKTFDCGVDAGEVITIVNGGITMIYISSPYKTFENKYHPTYPTDAE
jgi:hypothetical protein